MDEQGPKKPSQSLRDQIISILQEDVHPGYTKEEGRSLILRQPPIQDDYDSWSSDKTMGREAWGYIADQIIGAIQSRNQR